jgi:hypothetical protein
VEVLLSQVHQLLMIDTTSPHNDDIVAKVVSPMKINDHITFYLIDVIDISKDGLSHHVLSVNIIVNVLHQSLHVVVIGGFQLLPDSVLF